MTRKEQIDWQRLQIFVAQHPYVIASYAFLPMLVLAAFWMVDGAIPRPIWWWCGVCLLFMAARIWYHFGFLKRMRPTQAVMRRRVFEMTIYYTAAIPFLWAYPIIYANPDNMPLSLSLVCAAIIMIMGVVTNTLTLPRLYVSFSLVHLTTIALYLLQLGFPLFSYYVLLMVVFLVSAFLMGAVNYKSITQSIELQFENADLLEKVTTQNVVVENANLAKSRFLVAASHDLSQPLNALSLSVDVLANQPSGKPDGQIITHMKAAIGGLRNLFDDILDISRLDSDTIETDVRPVNLQAMIDSLLIEFESMAQNKGLYLRSYISDQWVRSDERQLDRVIRNLLSNAIKYTSKGGVLIGTRENGAYLRLEVWDTGVGIAAQDQANIFEEFYQVNNPARDRSKGIGLGLSIVHRVCQLLGHSLSFKSKLGKGSVFAVRLPKAAALSDVVDGDTPVAPTAKADILDLSGYSVMVVDDEIIICDVMQTLLSSWGANVLTATSLAEVQAGLKQFKPDLLLCDYWLKNGETGNDVLSEVYNTLGKSIPSLFITGTTSKKLIGPQIPNNIEILYKPIDAAELKVALAELIQT